MGTAGDVPFLYYADRYVTGEYIAVVETDSVMFAPDIVPLLFDEHKRPIIKGSWGNAGPFSPMILELPYAGNLLDCEQMPFLFHRKHLYHFRNWIRQRMDKQNFDDALLEYGLRVHAQSKDWAWWNPGSHEPAGFLNPFGHYIYTFHRQDYAWSVRWGAFIGFASDDTCPSLHG